MDENKPSSTDPQASGSSAGAGGDHVDPKEGATTTDPQPNPEEGQADVITLEKANELAGRTGDRAFKTIADFEKHYGELKSFVGKPKQEVTPPKPDTVPAEDGGNKEGDTSSQIKDLNLKLEVSDFLRDHPEAKEDISHVQRIAGENDISLEEAFKREDVTTLLSDLAAGRKQRNEETSIESNARTGTSTPEISEETKNAAASGDTEAQYEVVNKLVIPGLENKD